MKKLIQKLSQSIGHKKEVVPNLWYFFLFVILILGIFLRLQGIITNSFAFTYDVGRDLLALQSIVEIHKIPLIGPTTGLGGLFYGPWWYYVLLVPFFIVEGDPQGIALFMALIGITVVLLGFFLGKKLQDNFLGIVIAGLISFSPYLIGLSTQIWNPNIAPFFVILSLFFLHPIIKTRLLSSPLQLFGCGFILGLLVDSEIVFGLLFSLAVFFFLIIYLKKAILTKRVFFLISGYLFTFLPRIIFELRHDFIMMRTTFSTFTHPQEATIGFMPENILKVLVALYNLFANVFVHEDRFLAGIVLIACIAGWFVIRKKVTPTEKGFFLFFFIVIMTFVIGLSFFSRAIFDHYLVGLPIIYIVCFSLILSVIKKRYLSRIVWVGIVSILFWINFQPIQKINEIGKPLWEGNAAVYRNQLAVVDYVYQKAKGEPFNLVVYTPPVYDYTYQYLFSWYGKKQYNTKPTTKKVSLFFVIYEPDHESEARLKDWLKVREGDGKIQDEKVIKGGITVQRRIH